MMRKLLQLMTASLCLLHGCGKVGPSYHPPNPPSPDQWKNESVEEEKSESDASYDLGNWWQVFEDEILNELEERAVAASPSLFAALERVIQARATAGIRNADRFPQVTLDPRFRYANDYYNVHLPGNLRRALPPTLPPFRPNFRLYDKEFNLPFDLSYQLDLWGRVQSLYESAYFNAEAQEEAYYATMLTLTSDLASAYFQLRTLDAQIDLYRKTLQKRKESLTLNESRYQKGLANYIDVTNALVQVTNLEATLFDAIRQRGVQENAIALLIGVPAPDFSLESLALRGEPPYIPAGIPSEVLMRRPDIAQAEREMASQHAQINVAYAAFFPSTVLNGTAGFSVGQLGFINHNLTSIINWKDLLWNLTISATQTIFDAGRNCANLAGAKSSFREAVDNYQQQILIAFREVEDSLNNLAWQFKEEKSLQESVFAAQKTASLSKRRYLSGLVTYLEVVTNDQAELEAENNWVVTLGARYLSTIQLIKALGGGWGDDSDCDP